MLGNGCLEPFGDMRERAFPIGPRSVYFRIEEPALQPNGFPKMGALGAQPALICWMLLVSSYRGTPLTGLRCNYAAADSAVSASGFNRRQATLASASARPINIRPPSILTGMTGTQPSSSPSALPVMSEIRQL